MKYHKGNIIDMPKLESPFIRKDINGRYIVTPEINPDYEWVFNEPAVQAIEKLDGTNVSVIIENGKIAKIFNRTNQLDFFCGSPIIECLLHSVERGYIKGFEDGQWFGEAIGDKIQANPLEVRERLWIPFVKAEKSLLFKSWHEHPKTYENISLWFKDYLFSLAHRKYAIENKKLFAEGVVFYHPDGRMAKLRRDMFDWFEGLQHKEELLK